ncbi:MAG: SGNH/GDSL hydrolase family protein, partial [Opitutales bacterium]
MSLSSLACRRAGLLAPLAALVAASLPTAAAAAILTEAGFSLDAAGGAWLSPSFAVTPRSYYKIEYTSVAVDDGSFGTFFTNPAATYNREPETGNPLYYRTGQLLADNYTDLPASSGATKHITFARAPSQAAEGFLRFAHNGALTVEDLAVTLGTPAEARQWTEDLVATGLQGLGPTMAPPADRFTALPRTFAKLQAGETVRIAMVGDSIMADTLNSLFELGVEAAYAGASIELLEAVGHGTGMDAWHTPDETWQQAGLDFSAAVTAQDPDLVILGGISNGGTNNLEATEDLIARIRTEMAGDVPDILLMTGPAFSGNNLAAYGTALAAIADSEGVGFFDFYTVWQDYLADLAAAGIAVEDLKRDNVHNNDL